MFGLGLLLAIMAGAATAAAAGALRTQSAYPRFLDRYRTYDVLFTQTGHPKGEEAIAVASRLPQVVSVSRFSVYPGTVRTPSGRRWTVPDVFFLGEHARDPRPTVKVISGRMSRPSAVDEVMVSYAMADRLSIVAGEVVTITLASEEDPSLSQEFRAKVTGILAMAGSFESATHGGPPKNVFLMTPAFQQQWNRFSLAGEDGIGFSLRRGDRDFAAWTASLKEELARLGIEDAIDSDPFRMSGETPGVQALNRVPAIALWLLCAFVGMTTVAVFSQLLAREMRAADDDTRALRALGLSRAQMLSVSGLRATAVAGIGAVGAVGLAVALSPLTPVGLARVAEPDPGFSAAALTLAVGALATFVLTTAIAFIPAWTAARASSKTSEAATGGTYLADRLARTPIGLSARSGFQLVVAPGRGGRAVPVRTAILGTAIAISALAAALTFAVSLNHLIGEPRLAGYTWDAGAIADGFDAESQAAAMQRLERSIRGRFPSAAVWKGTVSAGVAVNGIEVTAYVDDGPAPSMIEGRVPRTPGEAAVDPRTLRRAGVRLGDEVAVAPSSEPGSPPAVGMRVVGLIAVPRIGFQGVNPGQGIYMTTAGFSRVIPGGSYTEAVYIAFPRAIDFERGLEDFREAAGEDAFAVVHRQQSATVGNVERISSFPLILAATMGILAVGSLAYALSTTIRRRRRDLAILKTIGFVGRQIRATVAWQSTALVVMSLILGLPVGIVGGRWGWRLFARQLQVVPVPVVSAIAIAAVVVGALLLGILVGAVPARVAARTEPALVLRAE